MRVTLVCVGGIGFIQSMFSSSGGTVVYGKIPDSGHWIFFSIGGFGEEFLADFWRIFWGALEGFWYMFGLFLGEL